MIFLCYGEINRLLDCSDYFVVKNWLHFVDFLFSNCALFIVYWHYATAILSSDIVALTIKLSRVVNGKENVEEGGCPLVQRLQEWA